MWLLFIVSMSLLPPGNPESVAPISITLQEKALLDQLAASVDLGNYQIRPPKGYTRANIQGAPVGEKVIAWSGKARADGSSPMIQINLMTPPLGQTQPTQDQFLEMMLQGVKKRRRDWVASDPEQVTFNGLTFSKVSWTGIESTRGVKMKGTMYATIDNNTFIALHTQDIESDSKSLAIGEAAFSTFKKK